MANDNEDHLEYASAIQSMCFFILFLLIITYNDVSVLYQMPGFSDYSAIILDLKE